MPQCVCCVQASRELPADSHSKLGQFVSKFMWVTIDPIGLKGLNEYKYGNLITAMKRNQIVTLPSIRTDVCNRQQVDL